MVWNGKTKCISWKGLLWGITLTTASYDTNSCIALFISILQVQNVPLVLQSPSNNAMHRITAIGISFSIAFGETKWCPTCILSFKRDPQWRRSKCYVRFIWSVGKITCRRSFSLAKTNRSNFFYDLYPCLHIHWKYVILLIEAHALLNKDQWWLVCGNWAGCRREL